ncbi:MAG: preprotein translocase subunit YajC [Clostridiales bacterium]|nr:preprotein translocase subunit YajC [Clostridiales bacterium]
MLQNFVLLEGTAPATGAASGLESSLGLIIIMVAMIAFMWFSGRKQRKRAKMMQERKNNLKNGDRVMMDCGIYGVVKEINDDIVTISVGPDEVKLVFNKAAISVVEYDEDEVDHSREQAKDMENK